MRRHPHACVLGNAMSSEAPRTAPFADRRSRHGPESSVEGILSAIAIQINPYSCLCDVFLQDHDGRRGACVAWWQ